MRTSQALDRFKDAARRFHSSYHLANLGLSKLAGTDFSAEATAGLTLHKLVDAEHGNVISELPLSHLRAGMKRDGPISQVIAHGILSWIYAAWNDKARKEIAVELGVDENQVLCDVMGDLRLLRNAIAHDFATAGDKVANLRELSWFKPGRLVITSADMDKIQLAINGMTIRVRGQD
jgi:hypothetical protein